MEIDENLEQKFKPLLLKTITRSDFNFHPSQAYSKLICKLHPFINHELEKLSIPECNIMTNSTELGIGNKYVEFVNLKTESDLITYQGQSVDLNKIVRFALDIDAEVKKFVSKRFIDVSNPEIEFDEMLNFMASSKMHVGIDSAPMHIALAMGKEVVMLWDSVEGRKAFNGFIICTKITTTRYGLKRLVTIQGCQNLPITTKIQNLHLGSYCSFHKRNLSENFSDIKSGLY